MKIIILCGGVGKRISSETKTKPKPMIKIGGKPILEHIMDRYLKYNLNDFYLLLGYKGDQIKNYFKKKNKFKIKFIKTGKETGTGGRILKIRKFIKKNENFMLTYGDGLTDQNFNKLLKFHKNNKKICTITIVRPPARFGEVKIKKNIITRYREKRPPTVGWINGGFMVLNQKIFNFLNKKNNFEMLEGKPMEKLSRKKKLAGFRHKGFWQCMDTLKEKEYLNNLFKNKMAPWTN